MRPWLLIDYDDTLGGVLMGGEVRLNQDAYWNAIAEFNAYMEQLGFDPDESELIREAMDRKLLTEHGFGAVERFGEAMVKTFFELYSRQGRTDINKIGPHKCMEIGMSVFEHRYMPLPGALDTLQKLRNNYRIAVVTKGNYREQMKKVKDSGVYHFVDDTFVMDHKNLKEWTALFKTLRLGPIGTSKAWAVGNAIRSDINVPVSLGTNGIHIRLDGSWDFEKEPFTDPQEGRELLQVANITQVLEYLEWS